MDSVEDITPCFCWDHVQYFLWIYIREALLAGGAEGAGTVFATAPRRVSTNGIQASKALCFHALPTRPSFGTTPRCIHRSHLQPATLRFWLLSLEMDKHHRLMGIRSMIPMISFISCILYSLGLLDAKTQKSLYDHFMSFMLLSFIKGINNDKTS